MPTPIDTIRVIIISATVISIIHIPISMAIIIVITPIIKQGSVITIGLMIATMDILMDISTFVIVGRITSGIEGTKEEGK